MRAIQLEMEYDFGKVTGPILDVDYEQEPFTSEPVSSLQDLCGEYIVSDFILLQNCVHFMPYKILVFIMDKALTEGRFHLISFLIKNWPYREFHFPQLPVLKSWELASSRQNWLSSHKGLEQAVDCATAVLSSVLETVHKVHVNTKLKFVDLSAVPLGERRTLRICNFICDNYMSGTSCNDADTSDAFTFKVHFNLNTSDAVVALHRSLTAEKMGLSCLRLSVCALGFAGNSICCKRTKDLLALLNPVDLKVLSLDFVFLLDHSVEEILPCLHKFHNLRVLDFSYCRPSIFGQSQSDFCSTIRELFKDLVCISRLSFSNCDIGNYVAYMLEHLTLNRSVFTDASTPENFATGNLEYLNLSGCCLSIHDLEYLAESPHAQTLKNLNICSNNLGRSFNSVLMLLEAVATSLRVLEIGDAYFREEQLIELFPVLTEMKKLCFLNITKLHASPETQFLLLPELCKLPLLRSLRLSVPDYGARHGFRAHVENLITSQRKNIVIVWQK